MTHVSRKLKESAMLTAIQKRFLKNLIIYMQPRPSPCSLDFLVDKQSQLIQDWIRHFPSQLVLCEWHYLPLSQVS